MSQNPSYKPHTDPVPFVRKSTLSPLNQLTREVVSHRSPPPDTIVWDRPSSEQQSSVGDENRVNPLNLTTERLVAFIYETDPVYQTRAQFFESVLILVLK